MGRKNKRKRSAYSRKMKTNPKRLITKKQEPIHKKPIVGETVADGGGQEEQTHMTPRRGDIWFAELGEHPGTSVQEGCRPAFIVSNDMGNQHSDTLTVIPLTSKRKKRYLPTHVTVSADDCPNLEPSMALAEQVTTIGKGALKNYVGRTSEQKIQEIEKAVEVHLGLHPQPAAAQARTICEGA